MAAISASDLAGALKTYYGPQMLQKIVFGSEDRVVFNRIKKDESFAGSTMPFPIFFEDAAGGRSATFSNAQTNASTVKVDTWDIDVVANHQVVQITTDALLRGRQDKGTFLKNQILKIDTALNNLANDIERGIFGNGTGAIGTISAITSTTITLTKAADSKNFHIGQVLVSADNASSALTSGTTTVTKVDFDSGVITVDTDVSGSWTTTDLVFTQGDYVSASDVKKISGFGRWLTGTGTIFGIDRSAHSRLQGLAWSGSSSAIKKAIVDSAAQARSLSNAKPNAAYMSWKTFGDLVDQVDADVVRTPGSKTTAGYSAVTVYGAGGPIECIGCTFNTDDTKIYLVDESTLTLASMGPAVRINDDDGNMVLRQSSAAGIEVRADSHAQLVVQLPAKNTIITLS